MDHERREALSFQIFGAGAIGCWVGGCLAAGGANVTLIVRPRIRDELANGLRVTDLDGRDQTISIKTSLEVGDADLTIVTVKSAATAEAATTLAGRRVLSLQNGVRNVATLGANAIAGMVPFNVIRRAPGHYHRASSGSIYVAPGASAFVAACRAAKVDVVERADMTAVQWGKLLMNLNNAINALSGLPLATELAQRDYRRVLAAAQREALRTLGDRPIAKLTPLPPRWIPRVLELPDAIFTRIAKRMIAIDPTARSSMWDDLEAGRPTEIAYINGEIDGPINRTLVALVRAAEHGGKRDFSGAELLARIRA